MSFGQCTECKAYLTMEEYNASTALRCGDSTKPIMCFKCVGDKLKQLEEAIGVCDQCGKPLGILDTICWPCQKKWEEEQ